MVKKAKGKHRLDKFYHLAKEQGYRSRAAFKLAQLNRKYGFLDQARSCLDLCAAPGGWMQVAKKAMPVDSFVLGLDLDPIRPIRGCVGLQCDITTQRCRQLIRKESKGKLFDVVVHDGAPNVGGAWASEAYSQSWLVLESLKLATEFLAPNGHFVTKVFRSADYTALLFAFNQLFRRVDSTKPSASRNASAEIFVVCQGYKAPAKIDPRLLDQKHLFKDVSEPERAPDIFDKKAAEAKRHRGGYEDGVTLLYKEVPALDFVRSARPADVLGRCNRIVLEGRGCAATESEQGEAQRLAEHPATTAEVRALCEDLKVCGRKDYKALLKWRLAVKRDFAQEQKRARAAADEAAGGGGGGEGGGEEEETEEEKVLLKMQELKEYMEARERKSKKRKVKLKRKARVRAALGGTSAAEAAGDTVYGDEEQLFSLVRVSGKGALESVGNQAAPDEDLLERVEADSDAESSDSEDASEEAVLEDARQEKYDDLLDSYLDSMYERIQEQKLTSSQKRKRARLRDEGELRTEGGPARARLAPPEPEEEGDGEPGNDLLVDLGTKPEPQSASAVAASWFGQDIFKGREAAEAREEPGSDLDSSSSEGGAGGQGTGAAPGGGAAFGGPAAGSDSDSDSDEDDLDALKAKLARTSRERERKEKALEGGDFAVAPMEQSDSESDSDSDSDSMGSMDTQEKVETMAMGKLMLRRKTKQAMIDDSYNRYAFHDENLPAWFEEDEREFMRAGLPVTGRDINQAKERVLGVNVRNIKKVAEAKARKKRREHRRMTQAKAKANAVAENADLTARAKVQEIEKLYAQARSGNRSKKAFDKAGKGKTKMSRSAKEKAERAMAKKPLDRRQLADKRGQRSKEKASKGKKTRGKARAKGGIKGRGGGRGKK